MVLRGSAAEIELKLKQDRDWKSPAVSQIKQDALRDPDDSSFCSNSFKINV
jgi:hypothetical protein